MRRALAAAAVAAAAASARAEDPWRASAPGDATVGEPFEVVVTSGPDADPAEDAARLRPLRIAPARAETVVRDGRAIARRTWTAWSFTPGRVELPAAGLTIDVRSSLGAEHGADPEMPLRPRVPSSPLAWWIVGGIAAGGAAWACGRRIRGARVPSRTPIVVADDLDALARQVREAAGRAAGRRADGLTAEDVAEAAPELAEVLAELDDVRYAPAADADRVIRCRARAAAALHAESRA